MNSQNLSQFIVSTLDDNKARDIVCLDVRGLSNVADFMVVATGTSSRHTKALAGKVADAVRESGNRVFGSEGEQVGEWVLLDVGDVLVHVMLEETRKLYQLEKLWDIKSLGATAKP
jgi:ribosome-associated protein